MIRHLVKSYDYSRVTTDIILPFTGIGVGIGSLSYITKDHGPQHKLIDHMMGAAFYALVGGLAGAGVASLHPIVAAGVAVGVPSYAVQQFRDRMRGRRVIIEVKPAEIPKTGSEASLE